MLKPTAYMSTSMDMAMMDIGILGKMICIIHIVTRVRKRILPKRWHSFSRWSVDSESLCKAQIREPVCSCLS